MKSKILSLFVFVLISATINAADFIPVKLIYLNGEEQTGYAKHVSIGPIKHILFKTTENAKKQKILSNNLKTIIYSYSNGTKIEYDRMRMYQTGADKKPSKRFYWLEVIKRDYLTMYRGIAQRLTFNENRSVKMGPEPPNRLFHRAGEDGATFISLGFKVLNGNSVFKFSAQRYFKDYPELSKKIKNKEYKWDDIEEVMELYNKWYAEKMN